jgi:phosphatidylglycerophosphatase A
MKFYKLIATGMGMGYSPIAPGTLGALGGCCIAVLLRQFTGYPAALLLVLIVIFFFLGVLAANKLEAEWGKDSSKIVMDEVVGMWIALLFVPSGWVYTMFAFILFRFFDIYKPLFIKRTEQLKGGWGVMTDDVVAGIYANVTMQLCLVIIKFNGL